jgi:hypothetical protein
MHPQCTQFAHREQGWPQFPGNAQELLIGARELSLQRLISGCNFDWRGGA